MTIHPVRVYLFGWCYENVSIAEFTALVERQKVGQKVGCFGRKAKGLREGHEVHRKYAVIVVIGAGWCRRGVIINEGMVVATGKNNFCTAN